MLVAAFCAATWCLVLKMAHFVIWEGIKIKKKQNPYCIDPRLDRVSPYNVEFILSKEESVLSKYGTAGCKEERDQMLSDLLSGDFCIGRIQNFINI
jgi:hypothetical protein